MHTGWIPPFWVDGVLLDCSTAMALAVCDILLVRMLLPSTVGPAQTETAVTVFTVARVLCTCDGVCWCVGVVLWCGVVV